MNWATANGRRWAFTLSNAGSRFFEDRADLNQLNEINWDVVQARDWSNCKDGKQAEFLIEQSFPWKLVERIGIHSGPVYHSVFGAISGAAHKPPIEIMRDWYY